MNWEHIKYPELLPRDARILLDTIYSYLLDTMRKVHVDNVKSGYYYHFRLNHCVAKFVKVSQYSFQNPQIIEITINIDGLSLSKSLESQVYSILCNLS